MRPRAGSTRICPRMGVVIGCHGRSGAEGGCQIEAIRRWQEGVPKSDRRRMGAA